MRRYRRFWSQLLLAVVTGLFLIAVSPQGFARQADFRQHSQRISSASVLTGALASDPYGAGYFEAEDRLQVAWSSGHETVAQLSMGAAQTALQQGQSLYHAGQLGEAIESWQAGLAVAKQANNDYAQVQNLRYLALAYQALGQWQSANQVLDQALGLLRQSPDRLLYAQTLNTQASLQLNQGRTESALDTWQQAEALYQRLGDSTGVLGCRINQAQTLQILGLYRRARTLLTEIRRQLQDQSDPALRVLGLHSLGGLLQATGYLQESRQVLEEAIALGKQQGVDISGLHLTLGNTYRAQRDWSAALNLYQRASSEATAPMHRLEAQLNAVSVIVSSLGEPQDDHSPQSRRLSEQLIAPLVQTIEQDLQSLGSSRRSVYARVNLAASLMQWQRLGSSATAVTPKAIALGLQRAIQDARTLQDPRAESYALGKLGHLYERQWQWDDAARLSREALLLAQAAHAPDIVYRWQWQLGRILKASLLDSVAPESAGARRGSERHGIEKPRLAIASPPRDQSQSAAQPAAKSAAQPVAKFAAQSLAPVAPIPLPAIALRDPRYQEALVSYRDAVTTLRSIRSDLVATEPELQFSFRDSIELVYRELVDLLLTPNASAQDLEEARKVIEELQLAELENFFRSACLDAHPQAIDKLDRQAAIIYPILLPNRLEVVVSLPDQPLRHHWVPLTHTQVESTLDQWLQALNPAYSIREQLAIAQQIYDWLIAPIAPQLQQVKTLVFVPDGMFRSVPLSALHDGDRYLIERYSVAVTSGLQLLNPREIAPNQLNALMVGLTEARQGFVALPGVQTEISQIQAKLPAKVFLNQSFTKTTLQNQLNTRSFPIVHLATHGQFSSDPEQTFLLTWDDVIKVKDIQSLLQSRPLGTTTPIELLVLSACQTAAGDRQAALGLAGLAVQSGARSTLATLWAVNDRSTASLMTELYKNLTQSSNISRGESLRQAQLTLLKDQRYHHPFYWGAFVLVGNWL